MITKTNKLFCPQEYIPHAYLELCIPATADGNVRANIEMYYLNNSMGYFISGDGAIDRSVC